MNKLRRIGIICNLMNDLKTRKLREIRDHVAEKTDRYCCKSTIEKDIYWMYWELDIEYDGSLDGITFTEKVDLLKRIEAWIK